MACTVVVGGGPAGLFAALVLAKQGRKVTVIESSERWGGLMGSQEMAGFHFDYGTHFLRETGNPDIDVLLLGEEPSKTLNRYPFLRVGGYSFGKFNADSSCVDARVLPKLDYQKSIEEFLELSEKSKQGANQTFDAWLDAHYGKTLKKIFFNPILTKFYGQSAIDLHSDARFLFGLDRILLFSPERSRELKKNPYFDNLIAYHSYTEGVASLASYYPKFGGMDGWVQYMVQTLSFLGVDLRLGAQVESYRRDLNVREVHLKGGAAIPCDQLIWTVSPALLLRCAGISVPLPKMSFRKVMLIDFVFTGEFLTDVFYFQCFDPDLRSFRVTLYPNFVTFSDKPPGFHCTVEVLSGVETLHAESLLKEVESELRSMGIVGPDSSMIFSRVREAPTGFPVLTKEFVEGTEALRGYVADAFPEVVTLGKASGKAFLLNDVFLGIYEKLKGAGQVFPEKTGCSLTTI